MSTFDKREESFEKAFAHDEELRFKAHARRDRMLGQWAAEKLGKTGADAEAYAKSLMADEISGGGEEAVLKHLRADFDKAGVAQSDHQIRRIMEELLAKAVADIKAGS